MGRRGRGEVPKKYSCKEKLNEKIHSRQVVPLRIFMVWLKKIHTREMLTKKNSCGSKIRHPPHNFFSVKKKFAVLRHCGSDRNHCFIIGLPVSKPNWKMEALVCAAERQNGGRIALRFPATTYNIYNHIPRNRSSYTLKLEKSVIII